MFRKLAAEAGLSLAEFGGRAEQDPAVDIELDRRLAERAGEGDCVLESRLSGWIARNQNLPALKVWIECDETVRAERVGRRDGHPIAEALAHNRDREASERRRYLAVYGIDLDDRTIYDLVLDSAGADPDALVGRIVDTLR